MHKLILAALAGAALTAATLATTSAVAKDKTGACYVAPAAKEYPGDAAPAADIATWMGEAAARAGLPPELPVMAALVDSGLVNLPPGDGDSAGYFQMRVSIWNKGDYLDFPTLPERQLKWFVDHAIAAKTARIAAGVDLADDRFWGEWVADVQRPAEQLRGRYQLRLEEARQLLAKK